VVAERQPALQLVVYLSEEQVIETANRTSFVMLWRGLAVVDWPSVMGRRGEQSRKSSNLDSEARVL
jgi:hypothetical protein